MRTKTWTLVLVLFFMVLFSVSYVPAHAGILSFLEGLLGGEHGTTLSYKNSQNVALLVAAKNSDPNPSKGGGDVTIVDGKALVPDAGPLGTRSDSDTTIARSDQINVYVVREGDTLSQIAQMFDVSMETILWGNDIGGRGLIRPGQTLVILPISGVTHTVAKGDTLASIAKKYRAEVSDILAFNELPQDATLSPGETLVVPDGKKPVPVYAPTRVAHNTNGPSYDGYYIRPVSGGKKSQHLHGYNAVDLAVPRGSSIVAAAEGEVLISRTGWNGGYGNYIVIAHPNGTQSVYAHNSQNIVYAGQYVIQGQVIGYVGSTGRSTGSHVHFEVRGARNPF